MMRLLVAVLLAPSLAFAFTCPDDSPGEGSLFAYTIRVVAPSYCSGYPTVYCKSSIQCPNNAECLDGTDSTPTDLDCIVTAISKARICAGGASVGRSCAKDSDCPSSTCGGDILMAWTDYDPASSSTTIKALRTCAAGAKINQGCISDSDCPSSTCSGDWVNRVVTATTGQTSEVHAVTCGTPETGYHETRFCVTRQRWAPP